MAAARSVPLGDWPELAHRGRLCLRVCGASRELYHRLTDERVEAPHGSELHFTDEGFGYLVAGTDDGGEQQALWANDLLSLSVHQLPEGLALRHEDGSVSWLREWLAVHEGRYVRLSLPGCRSLDCKVYIMARGNSGARIFWEARHLQWHLQLGLRDAENGRFLRRRWPSWERWWSLVGGVCGHLRRSISAARVGAAGAGARAACEDDEYAPLPEFSWSTHALLGLLCRQAATMKAATGRVAVERAVTDLLKHFLSGRELQVPLRLSEKHERRPGGWVGHEDSFDVFMTVKDLEVDFASLVPHAGGAARSVLKQFGAGSAPVVEVLVGSLDAPRLHWFGSQLLFALGDWVEQAGFDSGFWSELPAAPVAQIRGGRGKRADHELGGSLTLGSCKRRREVQDSAAAAGIPLNYDRALARALGAYLRAARQMLEEVPGQVMFRSIMFDAGKVGKRTLLFAAVAAEGNCAAVAPPKVSVGRGAGEAGWVPPWG